MCHLLSWLLPDTLSLFGLSEFKFLANKDKKLFFFLLSLPFYRGRQYKLITH